MLTKRIQAFLLILAFISGIISFHRCTTFYFLDIENIPKEDMETIPRGEFPSLKSNFCCDNVMKNLTTGRWIHWKNFIADLTSNEYKMLELEEKLFDEHMTKFRVDRGIHTRLWRDDLKCGVENRQTKPKGNAWGGSVGSWCNAKSVQPCCSDENNGECGMECDCERCIDMRRIIHAEFAKWVPDDARCKWRNYTAQEACKIVRKFSEIHVVGDSFARKMGRVMISMLRGDRNSGVVAKRYDAKLRERCVGDDQLYWTECSLGGGTFQQLLVDESPLCGMNLSKFTLHSHYSQDAGEKALKLAKTLAGKPGSLILLSFGAHLKCLAAPTFRTDILPIVEFINSHEYRARSHRTTQKSAIRWPLMIFMFPDTPDVLKSPDYRAENGKIPCYKFADQMIRYLTHVGIPYLDFRKLTTNVQSYDGTHHGFGVNVQKLQILFNYLESLDWLKK